MEIAEVAPARIEENAAFVNDPPPDENRTGQHQKTEPNVLGMRHQRMPVADVFSPAVGDDGAGQRDFDFGMRFKKIVDGFERAGQVLFVAVEIRENIALSAAVTAVDGVIHAAVLFDEGLHAPVLRQPVLRAVVRTGILHDVLEFDTRWSATEAMQSLSQLELRKLGVMMENFMRIYPCVG